MKSAIWLVCLLALPGAAGAQYIANYVPPADPYYRGPYLADRYSVYGGGTVQGVPYRGSGGYSSAPRNDWFSAAPRHGAARYFYYPNYPGMYNSPPARRPDVYAPPPVYTPHHDPFYEEHLWEHLRDGGDAYDYWGW